MRKIIMMLVWILPFQGISQIKNIQVKQAELHGHIGERIDACIETNVMSQDIDHLIEPFKHKTETERWQSEFWGKWMLGACQSYQYTKNPALLKKISYAVNELIKTQLPTGYIGNYSEPAQLAQWDVWGRKYCLLGLLAYYDITREQKVLTACRKLADHLMRQVGPDAADIAKIGNYKGMAASSILEPVMYLYNRTSDSRYFDFAKYIVAQWEKPGASNLISKAIAGEPVAKRFWPFPKASQWALGGHKSYEMMSCYVGLLELYKVTKNPTYLSAVVATASDIMTNEINIVGGASSTECWFEGAKNQTTPSFLSMETCVTFTWMQLCDRLLQLTGDVKYADQIEKTTYNALQAAARVENMMIASYVPLEGFRRDGERQCGMDINCCKANAPRAFTMLPDFAFRASEDKIAINLYTTSKVKLMLNNKKEVSLAVETGYPVSDQVNITVNPEQESVFTLSFRIPEWSKRNRLLVNGEEQSDAIPSGRYLEVTRKWKKGDVVVLSLDLRGKILKLNNHVAIVRGPVVLARDSRFKDGFVDETIAIEHDKDNYVPLVLVADKPSSVWMTFSVNALTSIYNGDKESFRKIKLCDFGSAGNKWDEHERYRVWLTGTIETADRDTWW
uniref:glycoside hydrolase family 127 protein n=1 Tax=Pedobacter schmidteae TaxID=2201271 RepID=UPI0018D4E920|nr:beta-L-arabinofuranosidase domain-containing protein [Pedobacter schmidteae]